MTEFSVRDIQIAVCVRYGLTKEELASKTRARAVARPRQVLMYLARELTAASYPKIGRRIGGRHHTTVMHGQRRIAQLMRDTNTMAGEVDDVRGILRSLPLSKDRTRELAALPLVVQA